MAKKLIVLATVFAMVFTMTACGGTKPYNYDLSEYVTLGQYTGIDVERVDPEAVTDEAVTAEIQSRLQENATTEEVKEGTVENGQTVNIDYEGKVDGKTFDGGSAEAADLVIGSGSFIDGFESGLVGKKVGETVELKLTFPDPYEQNADLAGKDVVFTVTINSIKVEKVPQLNEEFVKSVSDCKTVDEYKALVKKDLEEQSNEAAKQQMMSAAWNTVFSNCTVIKYPEKEVAEAEQEMKDYYQEYAETYQMELADFLEMAGMTEEEFNKEATSYAQNSVAEEMVMYAITRKEGIEISNAEYKEGAQEYVDSLGFENIAALEEEYTKETIESSLLWEKFFEFLLDKANIVEPGTLDKADAAKAEGQDADASGDAAKEEK